MWRQLVGTLCGVARGEFVWCQLVGTLCGMAWGSVCVVPASGHFGVA